MSRISRAGLSLNHIHTLSMSIFFSDFTVEMDTATWGQADVITIYAAQERVGDCSRGWPQQIWRRLLLAGGCELLLEVREKRD